MNQGKSVVVKQEMARENINILGISELKWMGMGEFKSDDHKKLKKNQMTIIYTTMGMNLLEEME